MNIPINCPCCQVPLSNSFIDLGKKGRELLRKQCCQIDHTFICTSTADDELFSLGVCISPKEGTTVTWNFLTKTIVLHNPRKGKFKGSINNAIPWFEPDITDYYALVKKLRTYVCFI